MLLSQPRSARESASGLFVLIMWIKEEYDEEKNELAYMIIRVEEMDKAKKVLKENGIHIASEDEIVRL